VLQVVMQFQLQGSGWSETHYYSAADPAVLLADPQPPSKTLVPSPTLAQLIQTRRQLLPVFLIPNDPAFGVPINDQIDGDNLWHNPRLLRIRVSLIDPGNFRRVRTWTPPDVAESYGLWTVTGPGSVGGPLGPTEEWSRLLCAATLGGNNNGHLWLGAIPQNQVADPSTFDPSGLYRRNLNAHFAVLTRGGAWNTRLRPYVDSVANPPLPIQSFITFGNGLWATVTVPSNVLLVNTFGQIIIRGRRPSAWNGIHRYVSNGVAAGVATLLLGPARAPLGDWVTPNSFMGTAQVQTQNLGGNAQTTTNVQYVPYVAIAPERLAEHKIGPPFGRPHGLRRRPAS
jgi:hypothetical protein